MIVVDVGEGCSCSCCSVGVIGDSVASGLSQCGRCGCAVLVKRWG